MSTSKSNRIQLGASTTATNNFTLTAEAANGTMKLARGNAGATTQDILTIDSTGNLSTGSSTASFQDSNGNGLTVYDGFKNKIINGNFDIWQRGTSQSTAGYGSADRWRVNYSGYTTTASRQSFAAGQTDVPNNPTYFIRVDTKASDVNTSMFCSLEHAIEDVTKLSGRTVTLSFWAKADASKNMSVGFYQSFGTGGSGTVQGIWAKKVQLTTTWKKFVITTDIPSITGKGIGTAYTHALVMRFWLTSGPGSSSFQDNQTNNIGIQQGIFDIAQVQLEDGPVASGFEIRPLAIESKLCYRYFYKTPTNYTITGRAASTTQAHFHVIRFPVIMRIVPSQTYSTWTIDGGSLGSLAYSTNYAERGFTFMLSGLIGMTTGQAIQLSSSTGITFDAEL